MNRPFKTNRSGWLALAILSIAAAAGCAQAHNLDEIASKMSSKNAVPTVPIGGKFSLVDTAGKSITEKSYPGKWQLIFFGFTTCPDVCSTVMAEVAAAMKDLGSEASKVQPLFITMDPARDSPQRISDYLKSFDSGIVGLRGTDEQTLAAVKAFHVFSKKRETGSSYTMDHSAALYLMKSDGSFAKLLRGDTGGHKLATDIKAAISSGHES